MKIGRLVTLWFTTLVLLVFASLPEMALAQTQGLVACTGLDCDFCALVETANRLINLFFEILIIVAVIMVVYAGLKLVTSGGNASAMQDAKSMLSNVIIGFVIILAAWLIVDTIFKMLVGNDDFGTWNEFDSEDCGGRKQEQIVTMRG